MTFDTIFKSLDSKVLPKTEYFLNKIFGFIWPVVGIKDCGSNENL